MNTQIDSNPSKQRFPRGTILMRKLILKEEIPFICTLFHEGIVVDEERQEIINVIGHDGLTIDNAMETFPTAVKRVSLEEFAQGQEVLVKTVEGRLPLEETAANAEKWERIGSWSYNLVLANCETFTNLCAKNEPISQQSRANLKMVFDRARPYLPLLMYEPPKPNAAAGEDLSDGEADKYLAAIKPQRQPKE